MSAETIARGDALDLLEAEDLQLRRLFAQLRTNHGPTVSERSEYGDRTKTVIRHLATREAAITEVVGVVADTPTLAEVISRIRADRDVRRPLISRVERCHAACPRSTSNQGQEFDGAFRDVIQEVGTEIEKWDLEIGLPAIKAVIRSNEIPDDLKSATHVAKHAPTNLHPDGPKWFERAPVISRLITIYDHLDDYPQSNRG